MQIFEWLYKAAPRRSSSGTKRKLDAAFKALHLRKRRSRKAVPEYDQTSSDSPKISSTTSSVYSSSRSFESSSCCNLGSLGSSPGHDMDLFAPRKGTWITTDSDFVVLELWSEGNVSVK